MSQTISQFPAASTVSGTDQFVLTQASTGPGTGVTRVAKVAQIGTVIATEFAVQSVAGKTGNVTLVANDITNFDTAVSAIAPIGSVDSDFTINSGTLVAASTLARTSLTVPATISSGTYDVSNPVSFSASASFTSIACSVGTIAAAGSNQATATVMTAQDCLVNSGTGGVELYPFGIGVEDVVRNRTTLAIEAYPPSGGQIENLGTNVAFAVGPGATNRFRQFSATQWYAL